MYRRFATACLLVSLAACSSLEFPGVYRLPVDQGNIITSEMVDQLKVGMSRSQVEYVMGTPMVRDTFSPNRWDYIYVLAKPDEPKERHQLTAYFDGDTLVKFTTDVKATDVKPLESVPAPSSDGTATDTVRNPEPVAE